MFSESTFVWQGFAGEMVPPRDPNGDDDEEEEDDDEANGDDEPAVIREPDQDE